MRKYLRKFNKKSKIIIIVAITILSMGIGYYAYSKENYSHTAFDLVLLL